MEKINFHTHSNFCDGKNSVEEMVLSAIEHNITTLGFSGHSILPFARSWHIAPRDFANYEAAVQEAAKKYSDKIKIVCGYEADYFPGVSLPSKDYYKFKGLNPEYLIGSVHYIVNKKGHYAVDNSTEKVKANLIRLYGKNDDFSSVNGKTAVCEYFAAERDLLKKGNFEILGHCDLIRKRNGDLNFFNEKESWYKKELKATVKEIQKAGVIVEINTGGMARGAINDFYPSEEFLQMIYEAGCPIILSSDAHNKEQIDFGFEMAAKRAKKIGYKELTFPEADSFKHIPLD